MVSNSYVEGLVFFCLGVSFFTFWWLVILTYGGYFSYVWGLVFLRLGVIFLTFWWLVILTFGG